MEDEDYIEHTGGLRGLRNGDTYLYDTETHYSKIIQWVKKPIQIDPKDQKSLNFCHKVIELYLNEYGEINDVDESMVESINEQWSQSFRSLLRMNNQFKCKKLLKEHYGVPEEYIEYCFNIIKDEDRTI